MHILVNDIVVVLTLLCLLQLPNNVGAVCVTRYPSSSIVLKVLLKIPGRFEGPVHHRVNLPTQVKEDQEDLRP